MHRQRYIATPLGIILCMLLAACATQTQVESSVIKTFRGGEAFGPYQNVLVVSAAGDRAARGKFEQELAANLVSDESVALPYFAVVGRHIPISRGVLDNAVKTREFDSILLIRRQGQERADLSPNRPTGRRFDLYRYDYEELNDQQPISAESTVSFVTELYDTATEKKVWAIESLVFESNSVESALSAQSALIAGELRKDRAFEL